MGLHERLVVEVGDCGVLDVATNIEHLNSNPITNKQSENVPVRYDQPFISSRGLGPHSPYSDRLMRILSNHLASVQKIWREKLKGVVGFDQPRRG